MAFSALEALEGGEGQESMEADGGSAPPGSCCGGSRGPGSPFLCSPSLGPSRCLALTQECSLGRPHLTPARSAPALCVGGEVCFRGYAFSQVSEKAAPSTPASWAVDPPPLAMPAGLCCWDPAPHSFILRPCLLFPWRIAPCLLHQACRPVCVNPSHAACRARLPLCRRPQRGRNRSCSL